MTRRFLAFSCVHAPFYSSAAFEQLVQHIRAHKPHYLVCLGDVFEADAASVWFNETDHDLLDEYDVAAAYLKRIRLEGSRHVEDLKLIWTHGNHCDNIRKADPRRIPKTMRRLCDWNRHNEEFLLWTQLPYVKGPQCCFQLGQVIFAHGFDVGVNSDELESLQFVNATGGHAHRLVLRGHTHRPWPITQCRRTRRIPLPYWFGNVGTMADIPKLAYAARLDTSQWGPAVAVGECKIGRACMPAKEWDAEIITL